MKVLCQLVHLPLPSCLLPHAHATSHMCRLPRAPCPSSGSCGRCYEIRCKPGLVLSELLAAARLPILLLVLGSRSYSCWWLHARMNRLDGWYNHVRPLASLAPTLRLPAPKLFGTAPLITQTRAPRQPAAAHPDHQRLLRGRQVPPIPAGDQRKRNRLAGQVRGAARPRACHNVLYYCSAPHTQLCAWCVHCIMCAPPMPQQTLSLPSAALRPR